MAKFIGKLPSVFNTLPQQKFFEATVDQLFQPKEGGHITGYVGRRSVGSDPITDFYLPEQTKERTWYQLEPTVYSVDPNTLQKTNFYFYEDLLNHIEYLGGDTSNHDRLFSSHYYSYAPPIDFDKFLNYQDYYWIPEGLMVVPVSDLTDGEIGSIVGSKSYTTPSHATPANFTLSSGMRLSFTGSTAYPGVYTVEEVGSAIKLIPEPDASLNIVPTSDYITIERGAADNNSWSVTNKWYHINVINQVLQTLDMLWPTGTSRAIRPIIEFQSDLELFGSGNRYLGPVNYGIDDYLVDVNNKPISVISSIIGATPKIGDLFLFFKDLDATRNIWEVTSVAPNFVLTQTNKPEYKPVSIDDAVTVRKAVYKVRTSDTNARVHFDGNYWIPSQEKVKSNQPPLFNLYDEQGIQLDDEFKYPDSDFTGSEIFSYKLDTELNAVPDSILGFPLVYSDSPQVSTIVFENDLITHRYSYIVADSIYPINGYYYYKDLATGEYHNSWYASSEPSKQRVIDRYVYGFPQTSDFLLSVTPVGYPTDPDILVYVNYNRVNDYQLTRIKDKIVLNFTSDLDEKDVIEIKTYTHDSLDPESNGYFEIPQQLEANFNNQEIYEYSFNAFTKHFVSIIENQEGFSGNAYGGTNNYRDTAKDYSVGQYMLQNIASLPKTMLASSSDLLNVVSAIRFSQNEYNRYKNKFINTATKLINAGFDPLVVSGELYIDKWIEEIITQITISKDFSNAFRYSYMIGRGLVYKQEKIKFEFRQKDLTIYADLSDPKNVLYLYKNGKKTGTKFMHHLLQGNANLEADDVETILLVDRDYQVRDLNGVLQITILTPGSDFLSNDYTVRIYEDGTPSYMPSTPSKLGCYPVFQPQIYTDDTYSTPITMILGHDGSKTPTHSAEDGAMAFLDILLLELETRIYNAIPEKFRGVVSNETIDTYQLLLSQLDVKPGAYRKTRYTFEEYLDMTESHFSKWATSNKLDFRQNEFVDENNWRTWNYSSIIDPNTGKQFVSGHWRGIYKWYYDTDRPHTHPWEMLGFTIQPDWWDTEYSGDQNKMWADIELGYIAQGARQGVDERFARPGMVIPTTGTGELKTIAELFNINIPALYEGMDDSWEYGDMAPVEYAWVTSSVFPFTVMELLYMTRPSEFGEMFWNPLHTTITNGNQITDSKQQGRRKNSLEYVHGEVVNDNVIVNSGYQVYISDRLAYSGRDMTTDFGSKVRAMSVNLAYRVGGFTNKLTLKTFLDGNSPESISNGLQIPDNNFQVHLHTGPSVEDHVYSGFIVRALADGQFAVYGYDLFSLAFPVFPRSPSSRATQITEGGSPMPFTYFEIGKTYQIGEIVRYNTIFYQALVNHTATSFVAANWAKLPKLPEYGGVTVTYRSQSIPQAVNIAYGTILPDVQSVFDAIIGYGDWLEADGWIFDQVNQTNNTIYNWYNIARDFLFWVSTEWAPDNTFFASPAATLTKLQVSRGYPANVEKISNGVYSIMDKYGISIPPEETIINRNDRVIEVVPKSTNMSIYYLHISATETEHIVIFDNITDFNDIIYDPVTRIRQSRLRFKGIRTGNWIGKMEAPGYLVVGDELLPNYENLVDSTRYYYDSEVLLDTPIVEEATRHLIGYEGREYLNDLELVDDNQYNFYQGFIRDKGTTQAVDSLLRSKFIQVEDDIKIYEEWGIRVGEFGGVINSVEIDFKVDPNRIKTNPQIFRLNAKNDGTGFVSNIVITNSVTIYRTRPNITIVGECETQATAISVLRADGRLDRIDIVEPGKGYTNEPTVVIDNGGLDRAFAILTKQVVQGPVHDYIQDVNFYDTDQWIRTLPYNFDFNLIPLTDKTNYVMPNAGYAHKNDVDHLAYDYRAVFGLWQLDEKPEIDELIWVASNSEQDWGIYNVEASPAFSDLQPGDGVVLEEPANLNGLAIIKIDNSAFTYRDDPKRYYETYFKDDMITSGVVILFELGQIYGYTVMGYDATGARYAKLHDVNGVDVIYAAVFGEVHNQEITFGLMFNRRFASSDSVETIFADTWIDMYVSGWAVKRDSNYFYRQQQMLINTPLFTNAFVYNEIDKNTLVKLPLYDPFKDILPGLAEQNIDFKTMADPTRYTHASAEYLIDPSNTFGKSEVGLLWWDLTTCRYLQYEQPKSGQETENDQIFYCRDNWGQLFPGSSVDIYEWVRYHRRPADYTGDGTVRNTTDYVMSNEFSSRLGEYETVFYFWVKNRIKKPNLQHRTLTASEVSSMISNPSSHLLQWFAPVQYTAGQSMSLAFTNVEYTLANNKCVIQLNYRREEDGMHNGRWTPRDNNVHKQWQLLREGDPLSVISDQLWNKLVDSLVGFTKTISISELGPDQFTGVDHISPDSYQLVVPDPALSEAQKYGIEYRPRQTMFTSLTNARQVFVQVANRLLSQIVLNDTEFNWDPDVTPHTYWYLTDWYEVGYDSTNTIPSRQVEFTSEMGNLPNLEDGEIIKVLPYNPLPTDYALYYEYDAELNTFKLVRIQNGAMQISDTLYTDKDSDALRTELRFLLDSLRNIIFDKDQKVNTNLLYFSMAYYAISEQPDLDWIFKTSYVYMKQSGLTLGQPPIFKHDPTDNFIEYFNEAKPYHVKLRDFIVSYDLPIEELNGSIMDYMKMKIVIKFNRFSNPKHPDITEIISPQFGDAGWDMYPYDVKTWLPDSGPGEEGIGWDINGWDMDPWDFFQGTVEEGFGWDSELTDVPIIDEDNFKVNYQPTTFDGSTFKFLDPINAPQELVRFHVGESIQFVVDIYSQTDSSIISYRQHVNNLGYTEQYRISSEFTTRLAKEVGWGDGFNPTDIPTTIEVVDGSVLFDPTPFEHGVIWINNERIEYLHKDGNVLSKLIRATHGTNMHTHPVNSEVIDGSHRQLIPNDRNETWGLSNQSNDLFDEDTVQAEFLRDKPNTLTTNRNNRSKT